MEDPIKLDKNMTRAMCHARVAYYNKTYLILFKYVL